MTIYRIEELVFGVEDRAACARFHADAGLDPVVLDGEGPDGEGDADVFTTPEGQRIILKSIGDPSLPPPAEAGSGLREIVWGVGDRAGLDRIAGDLARDRAVQVDGEGVVHSRDETGFGIAFRLRRERQVATEPLPRVNSVRQVQRWNDPPLLPGTRPRPVRIVHLALNIPKAGHREAIDFYLRRLRFRATDDIADTGTFMQCEGDVEHHNFFLCHRPDSAGINHFALEMRHFDQLIERGNHMVSRGWRESRVLGRHLLGSNLYRFFASPAGGRLEFACDMDRMDKDFPTRRWDRNPGHHIWTLKGSGIGAEGRNG